MKRAMLTLVLASAVVVIGRAAQAPPNLSGTWRPQNSMGGQVNPFEFTITQTADSVTIRTPLRNPESVTLKLGRIEARGGIGDRRPGWDDWFVASGVLDLRRHPDSRGEQLKARWIHDAGPHGDLREVHARTNASAADANRRIRLREPLQRQGPDRLEGQRKP
jgi:hypothetical protein